MANLYGEMRVYGVGTNLSESGLLRMAYEFRRGGWIQEAAEVFLELITRFPAGPKSEIALIRRAEILWSEMGNCNNAQACYEQLLEDYPQSDWADLAKARLQSMQALTGRRSPSTSSRQEHSSALPASSS
jgi:tetratricopeptide (TPR) repeat protein